MSEGTRLTERELTALEGAVASSHISVQQVVEAIISARRDRWRESYRDLIDGHQTLAEWHEAHCAVAEARAQAWAEGFDAGDSNYHQGIETPNPYRDEVTHVQNVQSG